MVPNPAANSCFDEETILALLEGKIAGAARVSIDEHLSSCAACGRLIAAAAPPGEGATQPGHGPLDPGEAGASQVGRYQVLRPLGAGGIGIVYAARDPDLDRPVAIKLLRPESDTEGGRARVLREAQAMARLAHPNVVAIYDVGTWREQVFIAMELIVGRTLRDWIKEKKREPDEIVATFLQAGRGLAAAHAAGIVHRDFKPDNVLIGDDGRVLVTDFGLARGVADALDGVGHIPLEALDRATTPRPPDRILGAKAVTPLNSPLTPLGTIAGTPAYMAPEQGRGEPASAEADIFSFCAALYEALYAAEPFPAPTILARVRRIEADDIAPAPPASAVRPGLRKLLLRGLRADPRERFPSMDVLLQAFQAERRGRLFRRVALAASLVALAIAAALAGRAILHQRRLARLPPGRAALAILAPENHAGAESAWLGEAFTQLLDSSLSQSPRLRVIPPETVQLATGANATLPADGASAARSTQGVQRIREQLGADLVVTGSYQRSGDSLRLELTLWNASTGEKLGAESARGGVADLAGIVAPAAEELRLDAGEDARTAAAPPPFRFPKNPEAARLAAEGLRLERRFDLAAAAADLEQASKLEPENPILLSWLSEVLDKQTRKEAARQVAQQALDRAQSLSREEKLALELNLARTSKDLHKAEELARALWTLAPDDIEAGLRLCRVFTLGSRGNDELAAVAELRKLPAPANQDPRIDLAEADGAFALRDAPHVLAAAARAFASAQKLGLSGVVASALIIQSRAEQATGDFDKAAAHIAQAIAISDSLGDTFGTLRAQSIQATVVADQGDLSGARALLEKVAASYRAHGDLADEAVQFNNLGVLMRRTRDVPAALDYAKRALGSLEEAGDRNGAATVLALMAHLEQDLGDLPAASELYERSIAIRREIHSGLLATSLNQYAMIKMSMGELGAALLLADEATRVADPTDEVNLGEAAMGRAYIHLAGDSYEAAEREARDAAPRLIKSHQTDPAISSEVLLSQALLAQGKTVEAQEALGEAQALSATTKSTLSQNEVLEARADVEVRSTKKLSAQTRAELQSALEAAKGRGDKAAAFGLRLTLGQLGLELGEKGAAQSLRELSADARAAGYAQIAAVALKSIQDAKKK